MQTQFTMKQLRWLLKGAKRERNLREKVLPGLVRKGKMSEAKAHAELVWIEKIQVMLETLIEEKYEEQSNFINH
jgi:hypothetical protein